MLAPSSSGHPCELARLDWSREGAGSSNWPRGCLWGSLRDCVEFVLCSCLRKVVCCLNFVCFIFVN